MSIDLTGMASMSAMMGGMNYAQLIQQLTQVERAPGDALNQYIQTDELKKSDWSNLLNLANQAQSALVTLADPSTFSSFTTTSSNTANVTATSSGNATPGTYTVNVTGLGQNATFTSSSAIGGAVTSTTTFGQTVFSQPISSGYVSVTIGNVTNQISIASGNTFNDLINNINTKFGLSGATALTGGVSGNQFTIVNNSGSAMTLGSAGDSSNLFNVIGIAGSVVNSGNSVLSQVLGHVQTGTVLNSTSANFATPISISGTPATANVGIMSINGVQISYNVTSDTVQSVINSINNSTAGVTAGYNPLQDKITLTSKTSQPISVSDVTDTNGGKGNLAKALFGSGVSQAGSPWTYTISANGSVAQSFTSDSATVTSAIPGVTLGLVAPAGTTLPAPSTITVAQNTDSLTKAVTAFTSAFNSLFSQLNSYTQLHGDLQGDPAASQLGFKLMNDALGVLPNMSKYPNNSVVGIGISNGAIGSAPGTTNSLVVDQNTLLSAFQSNPSEVQSLIQGMANRLNTDFTNITGTINNLTPTSSINTNLQSVASQEMSMYDSDITNIQNQQQTIYNQATADEQNMIQQFTQLQAYQSQMAAQQQAISAMAASLP